MSLTREAGLFVVYAPGRFRTARGHTSEFPYGRFERPFILPPNVDADHIVANYEHGVLEFDAAAG